MLFALFALIVLLVIGFGLGEVQLSHAAGCLVAAGAGLFVFIWLEWPFPAYTTVLAMIDVILILVIFKGDIRIH